MSAWKRAGVALGAAGALAGVAFAGNRVVANRVRRRAEVTDDTLTVRPRTGHDGCPPMTAARSTSSRPGVVHRSCCRTA